MQQKIYIIAKALAKFGVLMIALLSFAGAFIVAMTQYPPFRQWTIDEGLHIANNALSGKLSVEDVQGNIITGLTVTGVRLEAADTTFAYIPRISLQYHLNPILRSKTIQASVILHNPEVYLRKAQNGVWNFSQIAKPSTVVDTMPSKPLDWTFEIENLELRDGVIILNDEGSPPYHSEQKKIDFLHSKLRQVNLATSVYISASEQQVDIEHFSFKIDSSDLNLVDLAGNISVDESGLSVNGLRVETEGSFFKINAQMDSISLFNSKPNGDWMNYPFNLTLDANRADMYELRKAIPGLNILGGVASLQLKGEGTFRDINVKQLDLTLQRSVIHATARLLGLDNAENLRIEAELKDSRIYNSDIPLYLVGIPMPDLNYLQEVEIHHLNYSGTNRDLVSVFDISTTVGNVEGGGWLHYEGTPQWKVDLLVEEANPGPVLQDDLYNGSVTARLVAEGVGFDPNQMSTRFRLRAGPARLAERNVGRLWVDGAYGDGGLLTLDTAMVAWGDAGTFNANIGSLEALQQELQKIREGKGGTNFVERVSLAQQDADIFDGLPSLRAKGWYDMRDPSQPKYKGEVETDRLNLAEITLDPEQTTRLGLTFSVEGSGIELDKVVGKAQLAVFDAVLPDETIIGPFNAEVMLALEGDDRILQLKSDVMDAYLNGSWRFSTLFPTLSAGIQKLVSYVSRKGNYNNEMDMDFLTSDDREIEPIIASYEFIPKDLSLLQAFIPNVTIEMDATLKGSISGTTQLLGITARGEIRRFHYQAGDQDIRFGGTNVDAEVRNISSGSMDDLLDAEIKMTNDSLIRIGDLDIALPRLDMAFRDGELSANGAALIDNTYSIALDGKLNVLDERGYAVVMDTLFIGWSRGLQWRNADPVRFTLGSDGVAIESFRLYREGAELFSITGRLENFSEFRNLRLSVAGTSLRSLQPLIQDQRTLEMVETLSGNLEEAEVLLNGSLEEPTIEAFLNIDDLRYTNTRIGDLELNLGYQDQNLSGTIRIMRPITSETSSDSALAFVTITSLPLDLAFASREERMISGRPVNIKAKADDLPLAIVGPFTTGLIIHDGTANLTFDLNGTYPNIRYTGGGKILSGLLTVESTNVPYLVDGRFEFTDNRLLIPGIVLKNLPSDYSLGKAIVNGKIIFDGFVPEEFDLNIRTESSGLLVLSDATQAVNDTYYGDLIIATEAQKPLHFGGSYDWPTLEGDILVLSSDLKYPYRATTASIGDRVEFIDYEEWIERSEQEYGPLPSDEEFKDMGVKTPDELKEADTSKGGLRADYEVMKKRLDSVETKKEVRGTFTDRLKTSLRLSLGEGANIKVEIGPLQELTLNVVNDGPLYFTMLGADMTLRGNIILQEGSKLLYFKTFDATGAINFEDDILNPSMDISGTYEGTRTTDGKSESYTVTISLTGTLEELNISFSYAINGVATSADATQVTANALALLLTGRLSSELRDTKLEEVFVSNAQEVSSAVLTPILNTLFKELNVNVNLGNSVDPSQAQVEFVQQLGKILFRYDGRVSAPGNGTISVEVPISVVLDTEKFSNLVLELQRAVVDQFNTTSTNSSSSSEGDNVFRLRLRLKHTW
ncbi:MAG: hypothetical protein KDD67_16105 [Ignavibacteriae bacterium]|nr:hypothetical protein [Ignavibacteriota bacterium]MCB9216011.1 hypothetical protein [Ignavibacteria bacterium]